MKTKNYRHKLFSIFLGNTEFSQDKNSFIVSFLLYTLYIRNIFEIKIFNKAIVYIYKNLLIMHYFSFKKNNVFEALLIKKVYKIW